MQQRVKQNEFFYFFKSFYPRLSNNSRLLYSSLASMIAKQKKETTLQLIIVRSNMFVQVKCH